MSSSRDSEKQKTQTGLGAQKSFRLTAALIILCLMMAALLYRVFRIQQSSQDEYNKIVLSQRQSEYVSKTIPPRRGDIYDRNGNRLATSEKVYILIVDPSQMIQAEGKGADGKPARLVVEPTVNAVCEYFGADREELTRLISENKNSSYIRFRKDISYDQKQEFTDYQTEQNAAFLKSEDAETRKKKITGIWFEDSYKRTYPYGSLACDVVGFSSSDGTSGTGGVEQYYNDTLTGINGREYGYLDDDANLEKVIKSPVNGNTLYLTIDSSIQSIVEKYLKEWKEGSIGSKSAACIVMNPSNGEVLAMAGTESFDLNRPSATDTFTESELYQLGLREAGADYKKRNPDSGTLSAEQVPEFYSREEILSFGQQAAMFHMWRNQCISDTYEPGSTQKIFTVAGAIEEGIISPNDTFNCEGHIELSDGVNTWKINCVNRNGHGILDITGGITNSCNVVMMNIAFMEKAETFMKYERIFGLGEYTGIDLPAEAATDSLGFSTDEIGRTQLATNSFGQNYNCTMIQMAAAYCSIVNGGNYYQPHVVKRIVTPEGMLIREADPVLVRQTVSEETCNYLKEALYQTVASGTGKAAAVKGYRVGGKTGTAQKLPRSAEKYLVSFCGFAPVEDPALVCYVIVDEPSLPGQEAAHSTFASEIFSKIMAEALPAMGIYPDGTTASEYVAPEAFMLLEDDENAVQDESIIGEGGGILPDTLTHSVP